MKKALIYTIIIIIFFGFAPQLVSALQQAQSGEQSRTAQIKIISNITYASRYIWRGFDTIYPNRPALEPSITLSLEKEGLWFSLWSAIALADTNYVELDFIFGYDKELNEKMSLCSGIGLFTFPSFPSYPDKNSVSPEVCLGARFASTLFSPEIMSYYDFNLGEGFYFTMKLSRSLLILKKRLSLYSILGYTTQYKKIGVKSGWSDISLGISTDFTYSKFTFTPCANYVITLNKTINKENEFWVGLGLSF
jgi:uncharacterized protein (TIGR02001 family)